MILPIYTYGQPVLKKVGVDIDQNYEALDTLLANMYETMYGAKGVGLAAPQIGLAIRLFIVDTIQIMEDDKKEIGIKKAFINAHILEESGDLWAYEEGCLSIPNVRGDVERPPKIRIRYMDEQFNQYEEEYEGINARVIQHEYDHIEGILFTEKLKPLKKKLVQRKLNDIKAGKMQADYKVKLMRI
jgi:peptide deformylase